MTLIIFVRVDGGYIGLNKTHGNEFLLFRCNEMYRLALHLRHKPTCTLLCTYSILVIEFIPQCVI